MEPMSGIWISRKKGLLFSKQIHQTQRIFVINNKHSIVLYISFFIIIYQKKFVNSIFKNDLIDDRIEFVPKLWVLEMEFQVGVHRTCYKSIKIISCAQKFYLNMKKSWDDLA